jgi:phospholipid/cholesterol/gamma-HCH transport system substrate-binding protein
VNSKRSYEIGTGLFILLGFAALMFLATQTTGLANYTEGKTYTVKARFHNIGQLKLRAPVKIAGVRIGSVRGIVLEPDKLDALVTLAIDTHFNQLPDDSAAAIYTSGLLGDQYIGLQPGGSPEPLKEGDEMILTQNAIQLEELIGKYLVGGDSPSKPGEKAAEKAADKPAKQ